jgi:hypothetical protein
MRILVELKFISSVYKNQASNDYKYTGWYNQLYLSSLSHRAGRLARTVALVPSLYICYSNEHDVLSITYMKLLASIEMLFSLLLIDDEQYEELKYELERAMRENSTYCLNRRGYIHNDSSFTSYVKSA